MKQDQYMPKPLPARIRRIEFQVKQTDVGGLGIYLLAPGTPIMNSEINADLKSESTMATMDVLSQRKEGLRSVGACFRDGKGGKVVMECQVVGESSLQMMWAEKLGKTVGKGLAVGILSSGKDADEEAELMTMNQLCLEVYGLDGMGDRIKKLCGGRKYPCAVLVDFYGGGPQQAAVHQSFMMMAFEHFVELGVLSRDYKSPRPDLIRN